MLRRITLGAAAAAFAVAGLAGPAQAACPTSFYMVDVAGAAYVDVRTNGDLWIYQETNGTPGLQRGGSGGITGFSAADECIESSNPDLILY